MTAKHKNRCCKNCNPDYMGFISLICSILVVLCCSSILVVAIDALFSGKWNLSINSDGVKSMLEFWSDYYKLFKLLFASVTLLVAIINLKKFADTEAVKALSDLRSKLNRDGLIEVHKYFMDETDRKNSKGADASDNVSSSESIKKPDEADLMDYFGTIELGAIMLRKGLISKSEFYNQFGYRVENIMNSSLVGPEMLSQSEYYDAMLYAFMVIADMKTKSKV